MKKRFGLGFLFSLPLIIGAGLCLSSCDLFGGGGKTSEEDGFHVRLINPDGSVERDIFVGPGEHPSLGDDIPYCECKTPGNRYYYVDLEEDIWNLTASKDVKIIYEEAAIVDIEPNFREETFTIKGLGKETPKNVKLPHNYWIKGGEYDTYIPFKAVSINEGAFAGRKMEAIEIHDQIKSIGKEAFANCDNLTSVVIPESVKYIGEGLFVECDNLKEVTMNSNFDTVSYQMFMNCKKLEKVNNFNFDSISASGFENCESLDLTALDFSKIKYIGEHGLTGVTKVPETLDLSNCSLGKEAITNIPTIKKVILNKEMEKLNCFQNCENLEEVNISELTNLTELKGFSNTKLASLDLSNLKKLKLLEGFSKLPITNLTLSESLVEVSAFDECENLLEVDFTKDPKLEKLYGFNASSLDLVDLSMCENLKIIYKDTFKSIGTLILKRDVEIRPDEMETIVLLEGEFARPLTQVKKVVFPENCKYIQDELFLNNKNIETIDIPDSIRTIGISAFAGASNLREVNFTKDSNLNLIKKSAFHNCRKLNKMKFENLKYLEKVETDALVGTRLKSILPCRAVDFLSEFPSTVAAFYYHDGSSFTWMHPNALLIYHRVDEYDQAPSKHQWVSLRYNEIYEDEDGFLYSTYYRDSVEVLKYYGDKRDVTVKEKVMLHDGREVVVNKVHRNAFAMNYASKIVLPNTIYSVGQLSSDSNNIKILEIGENVQNSYNYDRYIDREGFEIENTYSVFNPNIYYSRDPHQDIDPTIQGNYIDVINHSKNTLYFGGEYHKNKVNGFNLDYFDNRQEIGKRYNIYAYEIVDGFIFTTKNNKQYCVGYIGDYQYELTFPERETPYQVNFFISILMCNKYNLPSNATYNENSFNY